VIISAQNLLQTQFPDINGFQETTLAPVFSNGKWTSSTGFQAQDPPCVQIHHNSRDHWVMSIQIENGDIYFFDSLRLKINTSLEFQLCKMYGQNNNRILIKIPEVQKQDNSIDCGLFAIANAVEFCNNGFKGGTHINYDEKYMRDHLIYCLERGFFSQFPKNRIGRVPKF
jgi:Ulp1 family protease